MKILLTSPTYPPFNSGLGNATAQQAANLVRAGHNVVVATGGATRDSRQEGDHIQVETFALAGADCWLQPMKGDVAIYIEFLRNNNWDVVLLNAWQNWATDLALRHMDTIKGRKFVYSHCISTNVYFPHQPLRSLLRYLAWRPYWWRLPRLMRRLDGILFLAEGGSDSRFDDMTMARRHSIPIHVIPNSICPAAIDTLSTPLQPFIERDRLMAVGSYQWQKGFDFVLRAYAASKIKNSLPLHLYGQGYSAYCATLRSLAQQLGLKDDSVVFHEGISGAALMTQYCRARLVLSGSHTECQPLTLLDGNAAGTPFVARATGCISRMPGGVGVKTWLEMARQIDELTDKTSAWHALADAGRKAALGVYHPDHTAQMLIRTLWNSEGEPSSVIKHE